MTTSPDAPSSPTQDHPEAGPLERVRSAVYGTVIAMSVLAYLGDYENPGPGVAAVTVAATGIVIFLAESYAGLMAHTLTRPTRPTAHEIGVDLRVCSYSAMPGLAAGIILPITALLGLETAVRIDVTLWLGVAALAVLSLLAGRAAHRRPVVRVAWTLVSLVVGTSIVLLKAAVH